MNECVGATHQLFASLEEAGQPLVQLVLSTESAVLTLASLQDLAVNGCVGATDQLFASLEEAGQPIALHTLSAKHTRGLHACWLGLAPEAAEDEAWQAALLASGPAETVHVEAGCNWRTVQTPLAGELLR